MDLKDKIDIYKLCIDMADKTSERRLKSNNLIITLNSILISLNGYFYLGGYEQGIWGITISVVCIVMNIYWVFLLFTYKNINEAKYKVINSIEANNDFLLKPFTHEYEFLKEKKFFTLSKTECFIPITLVILNLLIVIFILLCSPLKKESNNIVIINYVSEII
ncbi:MULTISPECIES: RipA family octameric membrane protein [Providencia]|uniref:RipA family octameric membrane protein n=1 Tax=Providencia TaxID=586 RepID=UPI001419A9F7|nr:MULTISPECIES: hypothetical protein [Providencia]NIH03636.1 hypothetical protein [Providencia rettgeri]